MSETSKPTGPWQLAKRRRRTGRKKRPSEPEPTGPRSFRYFFALPTDLRRLLLEFTTPATLHHLTDVISGFPDFHQVADQKFWIKLWRRDVSEYRDLNSNSLETGPISRSAYIGLVARFESVTDPEHDRVRAAIGCGYERLYQSFERRNPAAARAGYLSALTRTTIRCYIDFSQYILSKLDYSSPKVRRALSEEIPRLVRCISSKRASVEQVLPLVEFLISKG